MKEAGADAVKVEGAGPTLSRVRALVGAGVPVMAHIGLTPQSATMLGGFKAQGRTAAKAQRLLEDALALEDAGCFAIVLEAVPAPVAARITEALAIPTIGIGAGVGLRRAGARVARPARPLRGPGAAVREAVRRPRDGDPRRARAHTPPTSASAASRRSSTPTRCPTRSWCCSRRRAAATAGRSRALRTPSRTPRRAPARRRPVPTGSARRRGCRPGAGRRPGDEHPAHDVERDAARAFVVAAGAEDVPAVDREFDEA